MEWLYWLNFLELNARFSHRNGLAQQASRNGAVLAGVRLGGGGGGVWTPGTGSARSSSSSCRPSWRPGTCAGRGRKCQGSDPAACLLSISLLKTDLCLAVFQMSAILQYSGNEMPARQEMNFRSLTKR